MDSLAEIPEQNDQEFQAEEASVFFALRICGPKKKIDLLDGTMVACLLRDSVGLFRTSINDKCPNCAR